MKLRISANLKLDEGTKEVILKAIKKIKSYLENKKGDTLSTGDLLDWDYVEFHIKNGNYKLASDCYRKMDTASRDYLQTPGGINKNSPMAEEVAQFFCFTWN